MILKTARRSGRSFSRLDALTGTPCWAKRLAYSSAAVGSGDAINRDVVLQRMQYGGNVSLDAGIE